MVSKKRRKFEAGFKRQLLAQIAAGEISISEAARAHGISPTLIYYWQKKQGTSSNHSVRSGSTMYGTSTTRL